MNLRKAYRDAAQLAAIQLDRPFTAQDIARIHLCIKQAEITQQPNTSVYYETTAIVLEVTPSLSTETYKPLAVLSAVEEAIDESTRRVAQALAPRLPKVDAPPSE